MSIGFYPSCSRFECDQDLPKLGMIGEKIWIGELS